jgi:hypothetical protein
MEDKVVNTLQKLAQGAPAYVSKEHVQALALERMLECLDRMNHDYAKLPNTDAA